MCAIFIKSFPNGNELISIAKVSLNSEDNLKTFRGQLSINEKLITFERVIFKIA